MITSINEFNKYINEVRLPHGYFKITNTFSLPHGKWDVMFNRGNIIEIDTDKKIIKNWSRIFNNTSGSNKTGNWKFKEFPYLDLMQSNLYKIFKTNSVRLAAEETPEFASNNIDNITQFTTTVKKFAQKIEELDLADSTKIKVVIL